MKAKILASVIMSAVLLLVPRAFAQRAGQDRDALRAFQTRLDQEGFDVTPGAAEVWNALEEWCAGNLPNARMVNSGPNLVLKILETAGVKTPISWFKIRHDEAIVLI